MLEQNRGKEEAKTTWENNEDTLYQVPFPNSPDKKKNVQRVAWFTMDPIHR